MLKNKLHKFRYIIEFEVGSQLEWYGENPDHEFQEAMKKCLGTSVSTPGIFSSPFFSLFPLVELHMSCILNHSVAGITKMVLNLSTELVLVLTIG